MNASHASEGGGSEYQHLMASDIATSLDTYHAEHEEEKQQPQKRKQKGGKQKQYKGDNSQEDDDEEDIANEIDSFLIDDEDI